MRFLVLIAVLALVGPGQARASTLTSFASLAELNGWARDHARQDPPSTESDCPPDWEVCPGDGEVEQVVVTGSRIPAASITNNQEAGVDEGDIVKLSGDILVILRRGRLFTVDIADGGLRPVESIAAYAPGVVAEDDWYDEMLVADGWVVVIGYSYERETSEINRFRLDRRGRLRFVDSHRLTANDYYSGRNYASRLIGNRLVLYSPMYVNDEDDPLADAPRLSRLGAEGREVPQPLLDVGDIYRTPSLIAGQEPQVEAIHTIVGCDLTARVLHCGATAIAGPGSRTVYVATDAAYLWLTQSVGYQWGEDWRLGSAVYRIPLDGSTPRMARTWGGPVDQLSFAEDTERGVLNVLVTALSGDDAMWNSEYRRGEMALLTLPLSRFADGETPPVETDYRRLTGLPENGGPAQNRFVGRSLVYSVSNGWWEPATLASSVSVVPLDGGEIATWLMAGGVERIEVMGRDALVVTRTDAGVTFSTVNLIDAAPDRFDPAPQISHEFLLENTFGAETRSHAFFYQPALDSPDGERGLLGLPVMQEVEGDNGLFDASADMAFLRRGNDRLALQGLLESRPDTQADDGCVASCVDWYGDARPIFIGERVFALLGYELVEGRPQGRTMREIARVSFAPAGLPADH